MLCYFGQNYIYNLEIHLQFGGEGRLNNLKHLFFIRLKTSLKCFILLFITNEKKCNYMLRKAKVLVYEIPCSLFSFTREVVRRVHPKLQPAFLLMVSNVVSFGL